MQPPRLPVSKSIAVVATKEDATEMEQGKT